MSSLSGSLRGYEDPPEHDDESEEDESVRDDDAAEMPSWYEAIGLDQLTDGDGTYGK